MSTVAVIGLGYVGLPLVVEFGRQGRTIGFDISAATQASRPASSRAKRPARPQACQFAATKKMTPAPSEPRPAACSSRAWKARHSAGVGR